MNTELLITEVEKRPQIWDLSDTRHCNRDLVCRAWHEIGAILNQEVDALRRRWKSLRDNFRVELKKVPIGKSGDKELPIDEYLSKWPFFKRMFFLRDSMLGKKSSFSVPKANATKETLKDIPFQEPAGQCENSECQVEEPRMCVNAAKTDPSPSFQLVSLKRPNKRKIYDSGVNNENLIQMEREKLELKKQKVQLLIEERRRRDVEEDDGDRHFLLSLLPLLRKVPENQRLAIRITLQQAIQEAIWEGENSSRYI